MKTITFFMAPLIMGLAICIGFFTSITQRGGSALHWGLALGVVLLGGLMIGALMNFAIFAPVYWFLGRLHLKKSRK